MSDKLRFRRFCTSATSFICYFLMRPDVKVRLLDDVILRITAIEPDLKWFRGIENKVYWHVEPIDIGDVRAILRWFCDGCHTLAVISKQTVSLIKRRRRVVENNFGIVSN